MHTHPPTCAEDTEKRGNVLCRQGLGSRTARKQEGEEEYHTPRIYEESKEQHGKNPRTRHTKQAGVEATAGQETATSMFEFQSPRDQTCDARRRHLYLI